MTDVLFVTIGLTLLVAFAWVTKRYCQNDRRRFYYRCFSRGCNNETCPPDTPPPGKPFCHEHGWDNYQR